MRQTLQVRWTIVAKIAPQPWIVCSGCGGPKPFSSSGKVRLNANGRKLDAWLIYKCTTCDRTWNRPLFERKTIRDIDPVTFAALQSNDPDWIRAEAFNLQALRKKSSRIDEFAEVDVQKEVVREPFGWAYLEIELSVPLPTSARLDRLLAAELPISRSQLGRLSEKGLLWANLGRADMLRRRIKNGCRITLDLSRCEDRQLVGGSWRFDEIAN